MSLTLAVTGVIDYSTSEGWKYYEKSIKKLNKELFDYETDDLHLFINALKEHAYEIDWEIYRVGITSILLDSLNIDSRFINILAKHGKLTLEQIRAFEATCINHNLHAA